jgi:Ca-activated chloride channel homolog
VIHFESPYLLLTLLVLPVAALGYLWVDRRRTRRAAAWSRPALLPNMVSGSPGGLRYIPAGLFAVALALLLVGFARPEAKFRSAQDGATVVMLIDTSGSMAADDVKPTRLLAADAALTSFVNRLPAQYRGSIVTFSNGIAVKVPPTNNKAALIAGLPKTTEVSGTALGDAIIEAANVAKKAVGAIGKPGARPPASILIVSDGGQNAGKVMPIPAAAAAKKAGIPISTVAVGTTAGQVTQKIPAGAGSTKTFPLVSQVPVDVSTLKAVARAGGGSFSVAGSVGQLDQVYRNLGSKLVYKRELRQVTEFAAGAALVVMAIGVGLSALWFGRLI